MNDPHDRDSEFPPDQSLNQASPEPGGSDSTQNCPLGADAPRRKGVMDLIPWFVPLGAAALLILFFLMLLVSLTVQSRFTTDQALAEDGKVGGKSGFSYQKKPSSTAFRSGTAEKSAALKKSKSDEPTNEAREELERAVRQSRELNRELSDQDEFLAAGEEVIAYSLMPEAAGVEVTGGSGEIPEVEVARNYLPPQAEESEAGITMARPEDSPSAAEAVTGPVVSARPAGGLDLGAASGGSPRAAGSQPQSVLRAVNNLADATDDLGREGGVPEVWDSEIAEGIQLKQNRFAESEAKQKSHTTVESDQFGVQLLEDELAENLITENWQRESSREESVRLRNAPEVEYEKLRLVPESSDSSRKPDVEDLISNGRNADFGDRALLGTEVDFYANDDQLLSGLGGEVSDDFQRLSGRQKFLAPEEGESPFEPQAPVNQFTDESVAKPERELGQMFGESNWAGGAMGGGSFAGENTDNKIGGIGGGGGFGGGVYAGGRAGGFGPGGGGFGGNGGDVGGGFGSGGAGGFGGGGIGGGGFGGFENSGSAFSNGNDAGFGNANVEVGSGVISGPAETKEQAVRWGIENAKQRELKQTLTRTGQGRENTLERLSELSEAQSVVPANLSAPEREEDESSVTELRGFGWQGQQVNNGIEADFYFDKIESKPVPMRGEARRELQLVEAEKGLIAESGRALWEELKTVPDEFDGDVPVLGELPALGKFFVSPPRGAERPAAATAPVITGTVRMQPKVRAEQPSSEPPAFNPEKLTKVEPISTFSLNVSDVSFALAAASLERNQWPDKISVRPEEFFNAFSYHGSFYDSDAPVAFSAEHAGFPFGFGQDILRIGVRARSTGRSRETPLNIVILLDGSGSMERPDRLAIVREALTALAGSLLDQDKISIITFARKTRIWANGRSGAQAIQELERLRSLVPEGGTNLESALNEAYALARKHYLPDGLNRVVLLTDGAANLGNTDTATLSSRVKANRQEGIALDCFGIGWDGYDDQRLEELTRNSDGRYAFLNDVAQVESDFHRQLAGALEVAAKNLKVQIAFNPRRVSSYRQIGYSRHQLKKEQFRDNTVDAAELAAAETGTALYALSIDRDGIGPIGEVTIRYQDPASGIYRELQYIVPFREDAPELAQASAELQLATASGVFAEWLAGVPYSEGINLNVIAELVGRSRQAYPLDPNIARLESMILQARNLVGVM